MLDFLLVTQAGYGDLFFLDVAVLQRAAKAQVTVRDLAAGANVNKPRISRSADRLAEKGLLVRRPDKADKRSVLLETTKAGRKLLSAVAKLREAP